MSQGCPLPQTEPKVGLKVLKGLARDRSLLTGLEIMRAEVGPAFQIALPGFRPAVLVGPDFNRQIMISRREHFRMRNPYDPVTKLLRHGLLVEDGEEHACLRAQIEPALHKSQVIGYIPTMLSLTDRVLDDWADGSVQDMLVEMRRLALLIFMGVLLDVDFDPAMARLWGPILRTIKYISPGLWIVWPDVPRFGYRQGLAELDEYLYGIIKDRRKRLAGGKSEANDPQSPTDLLTQLIRNPDMSDELIRDQLLTLLIAGHDTSTALLSWVLYLLSQHPDIQTQAQDEVDAIAGRDALTSPLLNQLTYLDSAIKETLRLYPPIHVGNRLVVEDVEISGYELKAGMRVMASIYLSHRDERFWDAPQAFRPERFARDAERPPNFAYIPFGCGPRVCIGATFAQYEAKAVLARILQRFDLKSAGLTVRPHMGATLEPHPGVFLRAHRRRP
jgi:cytochrome P450